LCVRKYCQLFTHESITSLLKIKPFKPLGQWGKQPQNPPPTLEPRRLPCSISMPGPTPLTTPNDSVIGSRASTQLCIKVSIGYKGTPQIHPQNCRFPVNDHHPHIIHPTHHPKRHPDTFSRFATVHCKQTDRQTK